MNEPAQDPMASVIASFNGSQWAAVERLRAADAQTIHGLLIRIQELEGCLVYVRNFLPAPLKQQAEAILFYDGREKDLQQALQPAQ